MKIGFDFDGTIIDHSDTKIKMCLEKGKKVELWETNSNVFEDVVGSDLYKEVQSLYREQTTKGNVFPESLKVMRLLRSSGHKMFIVSARHLDSRDCALDWLREKGFLGLIPEDNIYFCRESEKSEVLARLGIDLYMDDKLSVLETLPPLVIKVLFDDQSLVLKGKIFLPNAVVAVNKWKDLYDLTGIMNILGNR